MFRIINCICIGLLFLLSLNVTAQEMPPRPLSVFFVQNLSFGAFYPESSGGSVTITPFGVRIPSGSVFLVNMGYLYFEAIFEIDANPGTLVSLLYSTSVLNGSNGSYMLLQLGGSNPQSPVITTGILPARTQIHIGGILTVGNLLSNPPGLYSGIFTITFIQE